jgi:hypothetical protein
MSGLDSLLEQLQRSYAKIAEVESVAARFPGDRSILANLKALKRHAASLEAAWQQEALYAQKEVCRYRIIPQDRSNYPIRDVSLSLANFQDLFSQLFDSLTGIPNSRAQASPAIASLALQLHFPYGSESIGHHDSEVMDGSGIDRGDA